MAVFGLWASFVRKEEDGAAPASSKERDLSAART